LLLAALYMAQEQFGWLSPEAIDHVAGRLGLSTSQVKATASFYTMFRLEPKGRHHIQVCEGLSCYLAGGAEPIVKHLTRHLGIEPGETTKDGNFSIEIVQCLAVCDLAPALKINDELYGLLTLETIDALLEEMSR
jgi:NADH-quinone oxidoreductase subunit E